jgi:hypothetical protein
MRHVCLLLRKSPGGYRAFVSLKLFVLFRGLAILLFNQHHDRCDLLGRDPPPFPFRPTRYHLDFETLVQPNSPVIVAQSIGK